MTSSQPQLPHRRRASRRRLLAAAIILSMVLLFPTFHSFFFQRVFADTSNHNPDVYPTGFSGVGSPVGPGDIAVFRFDGNGKLFDVEVRFRPASIGPDPVTVYEEAGASSRRITYRVPADGTMEFSWRPSQIGPASFTYDIRLIPNLGGISILPFIS